MVASGVRLAFGLFQKIYPTKDLSSTSAEEIAALGKRYAKWQIIILPFFFVFIAATGLAWFCLFCFVGRIAAGSHEPSRLVLVPGPIFWALPSMFLGIISSAVPTHYLMKAMLGERRYEEYTLWCDLQAGFDGWKAFRVLSFLVVCASGLAVAAGLFTWIVFRDDRIEVKRPWSWNAYSYPYGRVTAVARVNRFRAPNGNMVSRSHQVIRFDDGWIWNTDEIIDRRDEKREEAIAALVSERSGRPIQHIDLIDDLKP